ncbi:MAG: hypothetical protein KAT68_08570 [Bacteroidales bacterium]|nr:hypothetical protein [Bacteroidales bacterium]
MEKSQGPLTKLIFGSETTYKFGEQEHSKKARKISWIILPFGIIGGCLVIYLDTDIVPIYKLIPLIIVSSLLLFGSLTSLVFIFNKRFYNTFIYLLAFVLIGFIFKRNHLPGASYIMVIGFGLSAIGFFFLSMISLFAIRDNKFLRNFGFFINLIMMLSFLGGLFKIQHWPYGTALISFSSLLFLISVLSLVFTLPNSNYLEWTSFYKKFFYRAILIPMIFIFITSTLTFVFPNTWDNFVYHNQSKEHWEMQKIELFDKEGIDLEIEN